MRHAARTGNNVPFLFVGARKREALSVLCLGCKRLRVKRMRIAATTPITSLILFAALTIPSTASAEASGLVTFAGAFVYAGGQTEQSAREAAVELVVVEMNALIRGLARRRLLEVTQPWPRISLDVTGANLAITRPGSIPSKVALGGSPLSFTNRFGDTVSILRRFSKGSIIEVIGDGSSRQTNTLSLTPDSKRLRVRCNIQSPQLPRNVVFNLTYKRV